MNIFIFVLFKFYLVRIGIFFYSLLFILFYLFMFHIYFIVA